MREARAHLYNIFSMTLLRFLGVSPAPHARAGVGGVSAMDTHVAMVTRPALIARRRPRHAASRWRALQYWPRPNRDNFLAQYSLPQWEQTAHTHGGCEAPEPRLSPCRGPGLVRVPRPCVTGPALVWASAFRPCPAIPGGPASSCGPGCPLFSRPPPLPGPQFLHGVGAPT